MWDDPDCDDYERDEPCEHPDPEIDIMTGDWDCWQCGEHRAATQAEVDMMIRHHAEYAEWEERENRRQWWRDRFWLILHPLASLHWEWQKLRARWRKGPILDDDIPF